MKLTAPRRTALSPIRDEFDRLFDQLSKTSLFGIPAPVFESMWAPSLDFSETEKEYVVRLEVPGVAKEDLEVNVEGRMLTISGHRDFEKEEKTEEYFWREREQGRFVRSVQLPSTVETTKVSATYQDGVMTVRLPKAESAVKSRVQIK